MNRQNVESDTPPPLSGNEARRKFIKNSGGFAVAAPAVLLLLSAGSKGAVAKDYYKSDPPKSDPPKFVPDPPKFVPPTDPNAPKKNLLDP